MNIDTSMVRLLASCIASLALTPAAAAQDKFEIKIADVSLTVPIPAGYCLPQGRLKDIANTQAAVDTANLTLATLFRCDQSTDGTAIVDYYVVKVPAGAIQIRSSRSDFLSMLAKDYGEAKWDTRSVEIGVNQTLSRAFQKPVSVEGAFATHGTDDSCAYLGGTSKIQTGGVQQQVLIGACITTSGDKPIVVFRFDDVAREGGTAAAMRDARTLAMSLAPVATTPP